MSALPRMQGDFQDYLLRGAGAIDAHVAGTARVPVSVRLEIYAGAYRARLAEALASTYSALAKLLDADFAALAHAYVSTHDSSFFNIRDYGGELADFLARDATYAEVPLLSELARFEWAMTFAFDAADAAPLSVAALGAVPAERWAQLRFTPHPSLVRLALNWNAPQIWQALTSEHERPPAEFASRATEWLIWRKGLTSYFRSLDAAEARALDALRGGAPFGELCESLCEELGSEAAPAQAAQYLRGWVEAGLISAAE